MYHLCFTIVALFHKPIERSVLFFLFPFYLTKKKQKKTETLLKPIVAPLSLAVEHIVVMIDVCTLSFQTSPEHFSSAALERENARTENRRVEQNDSCI